MADTTSVLDADSFVEELTDDDDLEYDEASIRELWDIWSERHDNGAGDEVLIVLPGWYAQNEFDKRWPFIFAEIEYDDPDKGAILFTSCQFVDVNIVENGIWEHVSMSEATETLDISDTNDYIDDAGKTWIPRSLMTLFDRDSDDASFDHYEPSEEPGLGDGGLTGMSR